MIRNVLQLIGHVWALILELTILSIPRGPRLVLTTSATATQKCCWSRGYSLLTSGGDDICGSDVLGLFRIETASLVNFGLNFTHLNLD